LLRGRNWVIEPLGAVVHPLGFAVLQIGLPHVSWYERLRNALTAAINCAQLLQQVQRLVVTDPLTGLSNRRRLTERIGEELEARPTRLPLSLMVLDLDGFKALNDVRGHDEGDRALIETAKSIKRCLRETDTLARFGGDEFVAVLPLATAQQARAVAQRVLMNLPQDLLQNVSVSLTCSIGITTIEQRDLANGAELFRLADQALLAAKRCGKKRAVHSSDI
jgi:diguanylate cyclase (GGDEF)-like protein